MVDKCICCGAVIPEGSHVCPGCKVAVVRDDKMDAYAYLLKYMKEVKPHEKEERMKLERRKKPTVKVALDEGAKMPTKAHEWDSGFDLYSREGGVIYQNGSARFNTGVHIAIPKGVCGLLVSKSGLDHNESVQSTGLIDPDYVGSIWVKLYNHGSKAVTIEKGQKISQLVLLPIITPELELVDSLEETERGSGGFGSTGKF